MCDGKLVAIFRLTPVEGLKSIFNELIPNAQNQKILEVNNVAVDKDVQGEMLLGMILRFCAAFSYKQGFDLVAGIVRYEVLNLFLDFGTIPVHHKPLSLLGKKGIFDFVTYFKSDDERSLDYAFSRSYHYFHRKQLFKNISGELKQMKRQQEQDMEREINNG